MEISRPEFLELKESISKGFSDLNESVNNLDGRVGKIEDGLRGNEYSTGVMRQLDNTGEELEQFKRQVDLDREEVEVLKSVIRGAQNWKLIMAISGTIIGGLAGIILWLTKIAKNLSDYFQ